MRGTAQARSLATTEEIEHFWPGSELNPSKGLGGWIYCYGQMVAVLARRVLTPAAEMQQQQVQTDMLRGAPIEVPIIALIDDQPTTRQVHPKSFNALNTLATMERVYRETLVYRKALEQHDNPPPQTQQALTLINRSLVMLNACFAWIITHPGPGVPYPQRFVMPWDCGEMPPAWCFELDPVDIIHLTSAHIQVNLVRLQSLPKIAPEDAGERGVGWATFFVNLAETLHIDTATLMESHPLTALMARSVLAADMARRADAERKRKDNSHGR
jgi:hypothetical protein